MINVFRVLVRSSCGNVRTEIDFRQADDTATKAEDRPLHRANASLHGFEHLQVQDGLWNNWTQVFYSYEDNPSCPDCGNSPYLYCNKDLDPRYPEGVCVSKTRQACKKRTAAEEVLLFRPTSNCQSVHRLRGLPGDGRSRNTPLERCAQILTEELAVPEQMVNLKKTTQGRPAFMSLFLSVFQRRV